PPLEDRGSRIEKENGGVRETNERDQQARTWRSSILEPRSSILDPQSSIFNPRSSILDPRLSILDSKSSVIRQRILAEPRGVGRQRRVPGSAASRVSRECYR